LGTILVTGFEPFGGEPVNASWEAARRLDGWRCGDHVALALMLPCVYGASVDAFVEAFERLTPHAALMTGQAARRGLVCVERYARNVANAATPDNRGVIRGAAALHPGPERLEATVSVGEITRAIRGAGVPARVSTNAGDYVCNHLYYGALAFVLRVSPGTPAVFLHLPATPEQTPPRASQGGLSTPDAVRALKAAAGAISEGVGTGKKFALSRPAPPAL
jgi:pyroglutamyl-peptidase